MNFIFLVLSIFFFRVYAQDLQGLVGDIPFSTSLDLNTLSSGVVSENNFSLHHTFPKIGESKMGLFGRYLQLNNSKKEIPDFYNVQLGASYRHFMEEGKSLGLTASFGSASDRPFKDSRDSTILVNSSYQLNSQWIILGNYSNNRTFLNNIPLPGFLYVSEQSREKTLMLGFPLIYVLRPFYEDKFSVRYIGILPYNHRLRVLFNQWTMAKPYLAFEQGPHVFFDHRRESANIRTFWFERRLAVGLEKSFGPVLKIDLQLGRSFDREYFDARSYTRQHKNVRKIDNGSYVALNLKSSF